MKKLLLLLAILTVGIANAQRGYYYYGDAYLSQAVIESQLLDDPAAYNMWEDGKSNINTGQWILYPSSAVLGWNLGGLIAGGYEYGVGSPVGLLVGAVGVIGGYSLISKGTKKKQRAVLMHHKNNKSKIGWKPITNQNGGGIAITLN